MSPRRSWEPPAGEHVWHTLGFRRVLTEEGRSVIEWDAAQAYAFADGSGSLDVELAVEEMGINPFTAAPEKIVVFLRGIVIPDGAGHFLCGPQGSQIPNPAERVRADKLDVVSIMLDALHNPVAVCVPPTCDPGKLQGSFCRGPPLSQPRGVP